MRGASPLTSGVDREQGSDVDRVAIAALYRQAFPDEDLLPLVEALLDDSDSVKSVTASAGNRLVGHIALTNCGVEGTTARVALLGPLAVRPDVQGRGTGSMLVRAGIDRCREDGTRHILVLGDPRFYRRFGFGVETNVSPPYPLPDDWRDAWQSLRIDKGGTDIQGRLTVPLPWRQESLWLPPAC